MVTELESFTGTVGMDEEQKAELLMALSEPFGADKIKQRKGPSGKTFDYVEGAEVIKRLNAVAKEWSFVNVQLSEGRQIDKNGEVVPVTRAVGELEIPGLGRRSGMGVQVMKPGSGEDLEKGAITDAIKTAAKLFGVALHLYENEDQQRADWTPSPRNEQGAELATEGQVKFIEDLIDQGVINGPELFRYFNIDAVAKLTKQQATGVLNKKAPKKAEDEQVRVASPSGPPPMEDGAGFQDPF